MYNPVLDTFITVAQCRSLSKAAQQLYISNTAVMKQMNGLEEEMNLKLLKRSSRGIELTEAGKIIYQHALELKHLSAKYIEEARSKESRMNYVIRIGTSFLNPSSNFMELWRPIAHKYPEFSFEIIPYDEESIADRSFEHLLGTSIDMIYSSHSRAVHKNRDYYHVKDIPFEIALSSRHSLSQYNYLKLSDLNGYVLRIGANYEADNIIAHVRRYIRTNYPQIILRDIEKVYTLDTFNQADLHNEMLLTLPQWSTVHPNLFNRPVDLPLHNHFGIITSSDPSAAVSRLIQILEAEGLIRKQDASDL